jgi:hypothetical protein
MKKISLILLMAGMVWAIQPAHAQTNDTTKNKIEVKKKVKTGVNGRKVTKIKMEGTGTPGTLAGAADGTVTGKLPAPAVTVIPPPVVVTPPPVDVTPPPAPVPPTVIVVTPQPDPKPAPVTTTVTTTTETKPVPAVATSSTHNIKTTAYDRKGVKHVYHKVYAKKPALAPAAKTTTTTTTVKKTE